MTRLGDDAVLVLVHDAESLLELLDGLLVELSGLRSGALLGGLLLGGLRLETRLSHSDLHWVTVLFVCNYCQKGVSHCMIMVW